MITLDGAYGEGGGQMLRTALVLSLLTDQPFRIERIRHNRPQPGLKAQHAHILKALLQMSDSAVDTTQEGALAVTFYPGRLRSGSLTVNIGTAGAIPLFLQTLLPAALFAPGPVVLTITGGTDVRGAPPADFLQHVLLPFLEPYAQEIALTIHKRGFYPKGGGQVEVRVVPRFAQQEWLTQRADVPALAVVERGVLQRIRIFSLASRDLRERQVATRQAAACQNRLSGGPIQPVVAHVPSLSPGSIITAVADYTQTRLGVDVLGERGKSAEQVGQDAADALTAEMSARSTVDRHTADQLMLWVALFGGRYAFAERTGHITTNAWVIEHFLPGALRLEGNEVMG